MSANARLLNYEKQKDSKWVVFHDYAEVVAENEINDLLGNYAETFLEKMRHMSVENALRFGSAPYCRALNYIHYCINSSPDCPFGHTYTQEELEAYVESMYTDVDIQDIVAFTGIHNVNTLAHMLPFWPNAPVTFTGAVNAYGVVNSTRVQAIMQYYEKLKTASLTELEQLVVKTHGRLANAGYLSLGSLAADVVLGVHGL